MLRATKLLAFFIALLLVVAGGSYGDGAPPKGVQGAGQTADAPSVRTWHNTSGRKLEASLVEVQAEQVVLRSATSEKQWTVPLSSLSAADRKYIEQVRKKPQPGNGAAHAGPLPGNASSKQEDDSADAPLPGKVIKVTAQQYFKEFEADSAAAVAKYDNQLIEISGTCVLFTTMIDDNRTSRGGVYLSADGSKKFSSNAVACFLQEPTFWRRVSVGGEVTIRGVLGSASAFRAFRRSLVDGQVISRNSGKTLEMTAANLASLYAANPEETKKKYNKTWLLLEGPVLGKPEYSTFNLGTDKQHVYVDVNGLDGSGLKTGDKVSVLGECMIVSYAEPPVRLMLGRRVDTFRTAAKQTEKKRQDNAKQLAAAGPNTPGSTTPGPMTAEQVQAMLEDFSTPAAPPPPLPPVPAADIVKVSQAELPANFFATQKFIRDHEGKWIEVSGVVSQINVSGSKDKPSYYVVLSTLKDPSLGGQLANFDSNKHMEFAVTGWEPWKYFNRGDGATLRGKSVDGKLVECGLVQTGGKPVPTISASQLVQAFRKNPQATASRIGERCLVVRGQIADIVPTMPGSPSQYLVLQGAGKANVNGYFGSRDAFAGLSRGDHVVLLADRLSFDVTDQESPVKLDACEIIPQPQK